MVKFDRKKFLKKAEEGVQKELSSPDHLIIQTVNALDELNKIFNLCFERVSEWYAIHFPELKLKEPKKYLLVASFFNRKNPSKEKLEEILGQQASSVLQLSKNSVGVILDDEDFEPIKEYALLGLEIYDKKEKLENYLKKLTKRVAPNLAYLCGEILAARLIEKAGGLNKLATFPSSTIQVLGAEKALFKHLKSGSPPPKHGIIFQHPSISGTSKKLRGKIARTLASKIAIAAKADAFSKQFIAQKLKEKFDQRIKNILNKGGG
ncbi:MAG: NOP5/NOP56 family protein [Candidatus Anstonellaceae archaeon]